MGRLLGRLDAMPTTQVITAAPFARAHFPSGLCVQGSIAARLQLVYRDGEVSPGVRSGAQADDEALLASPA